MAFVGNTSPLPPIYVAENVPQVKSEPVKLYPRLNIVIQVVGSRGIYILRFLDIERNHLNFITDQLFQAMFNLL